MFHVENPVEDMRLYILSMMLFGVSGDINNSSKVFLCSWLSPLYVQSVHG